MRVFVKGKRAQTNTDDESWGERDVAPTMNAFDNGGESRATVLAVHLLQDPIHSSVRTPAMSTGASTGGVASVGVTDGTGVRRLTPRECERLMGWPDDWTRWDADGNELPDSARYRMAGNGVVAPVAQWIGEQIMREERR